MWKEKNNFFHRRDKSWYLEGYDSITICPYTQYWWICSRQTWNGLVQRWKENVQHNLQEKNIIIIALCLDEFWSFSLCKIAKEMWDFLQIILEGTTEVKRARLGTSTYEYELFRMKDEESISQMQTWFTHFVRHMRTLEKHSQVRN